MRIIKKKRGLTDPGRETLDPAGIGVSIGHE